MVCRCRCTVVNFFTHNIEHSIICSHTSHSAFHFTASVCLSLLSSPLLTSPHQMLLSTLISPRWTILHYYFFLSLLNLTNSPHSLYSSPSYHFHHTYTDYIPISQHNTPVLSPFPHNHQQRIVLFSLANKQCEYIYYYTSILSACTLYIYTHRI